MWIDDNRVLSASKKTLKMRLLKKKMCVRKKLLIAVALLCVRSFSWSIVVRDDGQWCWATLLCIYFIVHYISHIHHNGPMTDWISFWFLRRLSTFSYMDDYDFAAIRTFHNSSMMMTHIHTFYNWNFVCSRWPRIKCAFSFLFFFWKCSMKSIFKFIELFNRDVKSKNEIMQSGPSSMARLQNQWTKIHLSSGIQIEWARIWRQKKCNNQITKRKKTEMQQQQQKGITFQDL